MISIMKVSDQSAILSAEIVRVSKAIDRQRVKIAKCVNTDVRTQMRAKLQRQEDQLYSLVNKLHLRGNIVG